MSSGTGTETPPPEVVERLVASHREFLAFLERRVESRAIAEDILQQAFVRGLERASQIRDEESIVAWFYRVLRNAVIDHQRARGSAERGLTAFAGEVADAEVPTPDVHEAVCKCVVRLTETLSPQYADALRRIEIDGVGVKEYGEAAGITANNAGVRVFRARRALRERVIEACGTCAEHGCFDCTCDAAPGGGGGCH
jgi:RNA polymerase sigma-70 factor (ECF subfamily)